MQALSLDQFHQLLQEEADLSPAVHARLMGRARALVGGGPGRGFYMVQITAINARTITFDTEDDVVLVKFGIAPHGFEQRAKTFGFEYKKIFDIGGTITDEVWLEDDPDGLPPNFCKHNDSFYGRKMKVSTVKSELNLQGDPGPSEWRLMTRALMEQLRDAFPDGSHFDRDRFTALDSRAVNYTKGAFMTLRDAQGRLRHRKKSLYNFLVYCTRGEYDECVEQYEAGAQ